MSEHRKEGERQLHSFYTNPYQTTLRAERLFSLAFSAGGKVPLLELAVDKREIMRKQIT